MEPDKMLDIPAPLQTYFDQIADGTFRGRQDIGLNLLPMQDSIQLTQTFHEFHPLVVQLEGFVLDDPNTSNHHICLLAPPCQGEVLFLDHDGNSRIVFGSALDLVDSARRAKEASQYLWDLHPTTGVLLHDQAGLDQLLSDPSYEGECDYPELICSLLPSSDLSNMATLKKLASDRDFYIVEAVANAIVARPRRELESIAEACRTDSHPQAARAGERAISAIRALERP